VTPSADSPGPPSSPMSLISECSKASSVAPADCALKEESAEGASGDGDAGGCSVNDLLPRLWEAVEEPTHQEIVLGQMNLHPAARSMNLQSLRSTLRGTRCPQKRASAIAVLSSGGHLQDVDESTDDDALFQAARPRPLRRIFVRRSRVIA
jgi:hypothetical protein